MIEKINVSELAKIVGGKKNHTASCIFGIASGAISTSIPGAIIGIIKGVHDYCIK